MKNLIIAAAGLALLSACAAYSSPSQNPSQEIDNSSESVTPADFESVAGMGWTGTLSYLDYSKGTRESIPVEVSIDAPNGQSISYAIKYPGEAHVTDIGAQAELSFPIRVAPFAGIIVIVDATIVIGEGC